MIYLLTCPECGEVNEVETDTPTIAWECAECGLEPFSSLPTNEDGELI